MSINMSEAHPLSPPTWVVAENNVKPSKAVGRDYAFSTRSVWPPLSRLPERLAASRDVMTLERQAELDDAFETGHYPSFDSGSSSEEVAVSTRTPDFRRGHRRAMSSATTVPEITIQPPVN
jgi:hypothetical protein